MPIKTIPETFYDFLIRHGLPQVYALLAMEEMKSEPSFIGEVNRPFFSKLMEECEDEPQDLICSAFLWIDSKQGLDFWSGIVSDFKKSTLQSLKE